MAERRPTRWRAAPLGAPRPSEPRPSSRPRMQHRQQDTEPIYRMLCLPISTINRFKRELAVAPLPVRRGAIVNSAESVRYGQFAGVNVGARTRGRNRSDARGSRSVEDRRVDLRRGHSTTTAASPRAARCPPPATSATRARSCPAANATRTCSRPAASARPAAPPVPFAPAAPPVPGRATLAAAATGAARAARRAGHRAETGQRQYQESLLQMCIHGHSPFHSQKPLWQVLPPVQPPAAASAPPSEPPPQGTQPAGAVPVAAFTNAQVQVAVAGER